MLFQVVKIGYFGVQGGIHTAVQQQLNGLVQVVHAGGFGAIAFGQCCIGAGNGVGGGLAVQILKAVDAVIIAFYNNGSADVAVRVRKIVFLGALFGNFHAVGHAVIAAAVHAGQQAVPFALHKGGLYAKLFGNLLGNFNIEANQLVVFVMVGPGGPGALGAKHDLAALLNLGQQIAGVIGAGSGFAGSIRCRCSRGRCGGTAGGQQGGCQYGSGQCFQFHMCFSLVM